MSKSITAKEWADALKSGKYLQGENAMCQYANIDADGDPIDDELEFCCLGVLSDLVLPQSEWNSNGWFSYGTNMDTTALPEEVIEATGFFDPVSDQANEIFAGLNDNAISFEEIADVILEWETVDFDIDWLENKAQEVKIARVKRIEKAFEKKEYQK